MRLVASLLVCAFALPLQAEEKVLNLYNWADYVPQQALQRFQAETGIRVKYDSFDSAETPQFIGRVVLALHGDADCLEKRSGGVFYTAELASQYGVQDIDGAQPASPRAYFGAPPEFSPVVVE